MCALLFVVSAGGKLSRLRWANDLLLFPGQLEVLESSVSSRGLVSTGLNLPLTFSRWSLIQLSVGILFAIGRFETDD